MLRGMALQGIAPGYELFLCDEFWPELWANGSHITNVNGIDVEVFNVTLSSANQNVGKLTLEPLTHDPTLSLTRFHASRFLPRIRKPP
jgi:hypothetical protein